ncbi:MAG: alpha-amylase family glycosyl hydrolase, partial [Candidatus Saccharimonadales bacterium]
MAHQLKKNLGVIRHRDSTEFRVWAPFAKNVSLLVPYLDVYDGSNHHEMAAEPGGYWATSLKDVHPGQTYKFLIDTGLKTFDKNDPRGRALTTSEHGASIIVADDFNWADESFAPIPREQHIMYELHVGTFNRKDSSSQGTFYDAIEKLDYLRELGVNMIELMPVTSMGHSNGWGYNVADIFSVETTYGGPHGLKEFVKACHIRGIGVIVDVVYNHLMSDTLWQYDGWYENDRGGIYFYNDARGDTPWGSRPDYGRPEVRQFLLDNIVMWYQEYHVDGLRLDSTIYMRNTQGRNDDPAHDIPEAWSLLQDITTLAHRIHPGSMMVAEDCSVNSHITKPATENGCGFDAQWGLNFPHALRSMIGLSVPFPVDFKHELTGSYNNDVFERIIFSDSHDTAANGAVRLNEAASEGSATDIFAREKLLLANAVTLTAPGIPMLLQGSEFLQAGSFNDWQELEWDKTEKYAGIVLAHRHLIDLRLNRHGNTAGLLGQSTIIFHQDDTNMVIGYHRWDKGGAGDDTLVIANFGDTAHTIYKVTLPVKGTWYVRFNSSWKGYSSDFQQTNIDSVTTD